MPSDQFNPCLSFDIYSYPEEVRAALSKMERYVNYHLKPYIDGRTVNNANYYAGDEYNQLIQALGEVYTGEAPWIEIDANNEIRHRGPGALNTTLGVAGFPIETISIDLYNHALQVTSRAPATPGGPVYGENYWWCSIDAVVVGSPAFYDVTEVERTNIDTWQVLAGGLGTVEALNLAEEDAGTNDLPLHATLTPNVVLVTTKEDEDGDTVYTFRRVIAGANWLDVAETVTITNGAPPASPPAVYKSITIGGATNERQALYRFATPRRRDSILTAQATNDAVWTAMQLDWGAADAVSWVHFIDLNVALATADFNAGTVWPGPAVMDERQCATIVQAFDGNLARGMGFSAVPSADFTGGVDATLIYGLRLRWDITAMGPAAGDWCLARAFPVQMKVQVT